MQLRASASGTPASEAEASPDVLPAVVPPVVAVVVTCDAGPWLEETLQSLRDQTYPDLGVLIVDNASVEDPTDRIRAILPDAHIHVLDHDGGFGAAANMVGELVDGAAFYAFCHDDIALESDSLRALVEEAFRSNAGIIGPKLVDWNNPRRLLQVGMAADKTGVFAPYSETGELDQEQHDAVRDVFMVPGACTLVRGDLFDALGGYDEGIDYLGEDLDLCWRAHALGARVLIAPAARVRHLEALGERRPVDDRRRRLARHRLRTSLVAYGWVHRLRVIPQALLFAIIEALYAVLSGHPDQARDVLGAWPWNLRRYGQIRRRRRALQSTRRLTDGEVRAFQVRGSARFNGLVRGQFGRREDRVTSFARSSRDVVGAMRSGSRQLTGTFAIILVVLLLLSSRNLL
ncbi:MAG: glycosyltransferase, partial [Aquihabitans sp.]